MILCCLYSRGSYHNNASHVGEAGCSQLAPFVSARWKSSYHTYLALVFDHLGWNISKFAHKWETQRIPVRLSHVFFKIIIIFVSLRVNFFSKLKHTQCPRLSALMLKVPHTVAHLRTSFIRRSRTTSVHLYMCVCVCVWWAEMVI